MSAGRLVFDAVGERFFESGTDRGVLYQIDDNGKYTDGEAWNGLTAVNSTPGGAEANDLWADNMKYATLRSAETYGGTIECYTYPDSFKLNNGEANLAPGIVASGQKRKAFGLTYRTKIGNDIDGLDHGYKLHLVYNATVSPADKAYQTINESPDAITMSYEFTTTPITPEKELGLAYPTAHIEIDSTKFAGDNGAGDDFLAALEDILYGKDADPEDPSSEATVASLPTPKQVVELYNAYFPSNP